MKRIFIIGSGMLGIKQIATEDFPVIQNTSRVFWFSDIAGPHEYLSHHEIHHEDLSFCTKIKVLMFLLHQYYQAYLICDCWMEHVALAAPSHTRVGIAIVKYYRNYFRMRLLPWNLWSRRDEIPSLVKIWMT